MIHEEETTEIEIPGYVRKPSNVVRVDFKSPSLPSQPVNPRNGWLKELSPASPWVLRIAAAIVILGLSLLVL